MKYLNKTFSTPPNSKAFVDNFDSIFADKNTCDGTYIDFQGAKRSCLVGGEGCGLTNCRAAHGPQGGW